MPLTDGETVRSGRPAIAEGAAHGVESASGPTSPCKLFARIAGCKGGAETTGRLAGGTRVHGTVGVHTTYMRFGCVKGCVRSVRTLQQICSYATYIGFRYDDKCSTLVTIYRINRLSNLRYVRALLDRFSSGGSRFGALDGFPGVSPRSEPPPEGVLGSVDRSAMARRHRP
mgnify:CR=1 FL=1